MATSLAEQLKKLKAPQTGILFQDKDKKRPSLLFDPKEAANLDRETVLSIGQSGLQELIKLCKVFKEFEHTLFAQSSMNLERSVQDNKINKKLNVEIERFLIYLSPYFLLNTAHKALEWLIYRFRIHQFNRDQFLLLTLPYHETRMFIRAIQLLDLSDDSDKWHWLEPLQKPGVPLASITLLNRISSDNGLLKLLCNHIIVATKVYGQQASSLSTLYAFYTTALLGVIDRSSSISEVQVNHLLPALIKGLGSSICDFAASSYMILAKLTTKVKITNETMEKLLLKTFEKPELKNDAILLLLFLYNTPLHTLTYVPLSLVIRLSQLSWFVELLVKIKESDTNLTKFIVPFLESACQLYLENPEERVNVRNTIEEIFTRIQFTNNEMDAILPNIVKKGFLERKMSKESKDFLIILYRSLEVQYPESFDNYLKTLMKSSEMNAESKALLQFLTSWHSDARNASESIDILNRLSHINAEQRIMALEKLTRDDITIPETFHEMSNNVLLARFNDHEVNVVKTLLTIPTKRLTSLLSVDVLINELLVLLSTCHIDSRKILAKPALKILLELCDDGNDTSVFIIALPYLFPADESDVDTAMEVLKSNFAKKNKYMQNVVKDIGASLNAENVMSAAFHNVLNWELLPPAEDILNAMKISHGDAVSMFFNMILLGSVCRVPVGSLPAQTARDVIEMAMNIIKRFPHVQLLKNCNHLTGDNMRIALDLTSRGILPLQVGTYVLEMVHRRLDLKSNQILDFINNKDHSLLIVRLLEMFFEGIGNKFWCSHYSRCLQIFFQRHFATAKDLIRFLSQFFIKPVKTQTSLYCLQITLVLLNQCKSMQWAFQDKIFMTNLILSLARDNNECRTAAIKILKKLLQTFNLSADAFSTLLFELNERSAEISLDPDQLSLSLYMLLSPDPDVRKQLKTRIRDKLQETCQHLFNMLVDITTPIHIKSQLTDVLVHVTDSVILKKIAPLGLNLLHEMAGSSKNNYAGNTLKNILQRFNSVTVKALMEQEVWKLFEESLLEHRYELQTETGSYSPSIILLKQIDETFFKSVGKISLQLQERIFHKLVDIASDCDINNVVSNANRVIRRIPINARLIVNELNNMNNLRDKRFDDKKIQSKKRFSSVTSPPDPMILNGKEWKRGTTLLEFAQRASNIEQEELLYPILFNLLKLCLSFEEQSPVEYTNQLLLSTIHRLAVKLTVRDAQLQIDLITQCIRTSRNPQTHHHALLVLVELLKVIDVRSALVAIMPIFTFMGSSVVRQDDAYSIQIISKTIETVVPIVNAIENETHACEILRTFIISLPDIPEHRRVPLFVKILQLLENHLHCYYLLTFESFVLSKSRIAKPETASQRLEFAHQISHEFSPQRLIRVCIELLKFMRELPIDITDEKDRKNAMSFPYKHIYDVANNTPKDLRQYKFTLIQFMGNLLSAPDFISRVAELNSDEVNEIRPYYDKLIVHLIVLIQSTSKIADVHQGKLIGKYCKVLLHHLYDVLNFVNNLLPNEMFLISIKKLIEHELLPVRRKALELLNTRLQQRKISEQNYPDLLNLIEALMKMLKIKTVSDVPDVEVVQQTVLITLKHLAKLLAGDNPTIFKPILEMTTELLKSKDGPVLASAVLCVAELCSSMRTHAIQSLNKFVPAILRLLEKHDYQETPDIVIISIVSALQKVVESIGNFLSLYLDRLLFELARLNSFYVDAEHPKIGIIVSRVKATTQKLSNCIPLRILLPAVNRTYETLLVKRFYKSIPPLMNILAECFVNVQSTDLNAAIQDLGSFFLKVLQFREDSSDNDMIIDKQEKTLEDIVRVEESASKALVALVLKLSEATFRPLYYKLYDWAAKTPQRNITFYRLSANIAECLKSLFVLFAGHFIKHAVVLLSSNNPAVLQEPQEFTLSEESSKIELIEAILLTLHRVFSYDAHNFVTQDRFELLVQPIVDQLENTLGGKELYEKRATELIVPCIASFAAAIPDDSLHKQLLYQTLMKTRHTRPHVRRAALSAVVEITRKLAEDFMPLLPETVPFLAELLEDEDEVTEKCAQDAVRTLEEILGEPLQKYF